MATNFAWTKPTAQASRQVSASLASGARFGNGHKHPPTKKQQTAAKPRAYAARTPGGGSGGRMVGIPVGGGKPSVEKKILGALAELEILGITNPSRVQIALFSGYTNVKSAGFAKAVSIAKAKGSIEYPSSKSMRLTSKGKWEAPPTLNPPQTNADVHIRIKKLLKPTAVQLFDLLADGLPHPREEVAEAMGYTNQKSAGFAKALSSMSSLGFIFYPKAPAGSKVSQVQLVADIAFPISDGNRSGGGRVAEGSEVYSVYSDSSNESEEDSEVSDAYESDA